VTSPLPASCKTFDSFSRHAVVAFVPLHALIVDDNATFRTTARHLLERDGIVIVGTVSTGAEALRASKALEFVDVILVDIDLGQESGFDLAERLHSASGGRHPVILISVYAEQDFEDLFTASSAIGFVSKATLSAQTIREMLARGRG
jgi:CheY-like chemotaxis protein